MKVSAKIDYACRALLELAVHWPDATPLQISAIAKRQKIPMKYLVHILIALKELGYVESTRGKSGGYILTKPPKEIKLGAIVKNFGGLGYSENETLKIRKSTHVIDSVWKEVEESIFSSIDMINFEVLCNRHRIAGQTLTYEI